MIKLSLFTILFLAGVSIFAQSVVSPDTLSPQREYENVYVEKLHSSSDASSFLIWVKNEVQPHFHQHHTEHVYVIEGTGVMLLNEGLIAIKPGDVIILPQGTVHAVKRTGDKPLKVLSVQSPEFKGEDRVIAESPLWPVNGQ